MLPQTSVTLKPFWCLLLSLEAFPAFWVFRGYPGKLVRSVFPPWMMWSTSYLHSLIKSYQSVCEAQELIKKYCGWQVFCMQVWTEGFIYRFPECSQHFLHPSLRPSTRNSSFPASDTVFLKFKWVAVRGVTVVSSFSSPLFCWRLPVMLCWWGEQGSPLFHPLNLCMKIEGEKKTQLDKTVFWPPHMDCSMHTCKTGTHTHGCACTYHTVRLNIYHTHADVHNTHTHHIFIEVISRVF